LKKDLSVAQVRVIFQLPPEYGRFDIPLAYVEWYTPLQSFVPSLGMYQVTCSSRNHYRHASIIPVNQIVRSCHLIPKFGTKIGRTWNADNILNSADTYYLNPDLRLHDFILYRYMNPTSSQTRFWLSGLYHHLAAFLCAPLCPSLSFVLWRSDSIQTSTVQLDNGISGELSRHAIWRCDGNLELICQRYFRVSWSVEARYLWRYKAMAILNSFVNDIFESPWWSVEARYLWGHKVMAILNSFVNDIIDVFKSSWWIVEARYLCLRGTKSVTSSWGVK
jgi:hypothetical protein